MLCVVLGVATRANAEPKPKPVDIKSFRDTLRVFKDAEGGIYVVNTDWSNSRIFYGKGKTLHEQVPGGGRSRDGDAYSLTVWAPNLELPFIGTFERKKDGTYTASCGTESEWALSEVTGDAATAVLAKSKFMTTTIVRRPYMLARDDRGVYYYVDVISKEYGGNGHRVFVGKKGALKQYALTDVITDENGDVFTTKTGDLRFVRDTQNSAKHTAFWIRGGKRTELTSLDLYMATATIYRTLGIYKLAGAMCAGY